MAERTKHEVAHVAAVWWANRVVHPKFDNGDPSMVGGMSTMLATFGTKDVTTEAKLKFIDLLTDFIEEGIKNGLEITLSVDYSPCQELGELAKLAGIPLGNFPWKTHMWIRENFIKASYGYRAEYEYPLDQPEEE